MSRSLARLWTALALALLCLTPVRAAEPTKEQIAKWVRDLGDDSFAGREEATKRLGEAGPAAEEAVKAAIKSDDLETSRRATQLYEKFKWGIYPDTPKEVLDRIDQYQAAAENARAELLAPLFESGAPGFRV